jgi:hypothetical protein
MMVRFHVQIVPKLHEADSNYQQHENTTPNWSLNFECLDDLFQKQRHHKRIDLIFLQSLHSGIIQREQDIANLQLILAFFRGKTYKDSRQFIPDGELVAEWFHDKFNVAMATVSRYENFTSLIEFYPRLLFAKLKFDQFTKHNNDIITYLEENSTLAYDLSNSVNLEVNSIPIEITVLETHDDIFFHKKLCLDGDYVFEDDSWYVANDNDAAKAMETDL